MKDKERIAVVHQIGDKKHTTERHYNHRTGKLEDYDEYDNVEKSKSTIATLPFCIMYYDLHIFSYWIILLRHSISILDDEWWFDYEWKKRIGKLNKKIEDYRRTKLDEYLSSVKPKKEYKSGGYDRSSMPALYPSIYLGSSDDSDNDDYSVIRRRKKKYPKVCTETRPLSKEMREFREGLDYLQRYV